MWASHVSLSYLKQLPVLNRTKTKPNSACWPHVQELKSRFNYYLLMHLLRESMYKDFCLFGWYKLKFHICISSIEVLERMLTWACVVDRTCMTGLGW